MEELLNPTSNTFIDGGLSYSIPEDYKIEDMFVVCMISKYNPNNLQDIEVIQAAQMKLTEGFITSTKDAELLEEIPVFPNPASDVLSIQTTEPIQELKIYNSLGQKVLSSKNIDNQQIDISRLPVGNYHLHLTIDNKIAKNQFSIIR